ncbi:MAG: hypothetical protein OEZ01_12695 [Candidatus Heimdallarchaeota archaeon]|nr:hypothetical protein [Candidatus Heimdallarchaeota archaeon]MDH5646864.1 hypothetical protein [Candidatus Heimdallarchaeota archaeon]
MPEDINLEVIQNQIGNIEEIIRPVVSNYIPVGASELKAYFDEEAPSGDTTTLSDILENKWLLIHELIELSELKNSGFTITASLLRTHSLEVEYAHITATEYELKFAFEGNDIEWINSRLENVKYWSNDDLLPHELRLRCDELILKYSESG